MKLNNRKDFITSLPEGEAPQSKKSKFTLFLYFIVISSIVLYIAYVIGMRFLFFTSIGFVEVEKITISSISGGRILSLNGREGGKLRANEVIATVKNNQHCIPSVTINMDNRSENIKFDINSDKLKLTFLHAQIKQIKIEKKENEIFRTLELTGDVFSDNEKLLRNKRKLEHEAGLLNYKLKLKKERLQNMATLNAAQALLQCSDETISLPFSTTIYSVQKTAKETVTRSESIMKVIADDAPVKIDFYLNMRLHSSLKVGDILELEFPGEIESSGKIKFITSAALNQDERILDKYVPIRMNLRIVLKPVNKEQAAIWKLFNQKTVKVRGRK